MKGGGVQAESAGAVWAMERNTFRSIIVVSTMQKRQQYEECLASMPLFTSLTPHQRSAIADCLSLETFQVIPLLFAPSVATSVPRHCACLQYLLSFCMPTLHSQARVIAESLLHEKLERFNRLLAYC